MKHTKLLVVVIFMTTRFLFAQEKKVLDNTSYENWESVEQPGFSENGRYVSYQIKRGNTRELVLKSIAGEWTSNFLDVQTHNFLEGTNYYCLLTTSNELKVGLLGKQVSREIQDIRRYETKLLNGSWLVCELASNKSETILLNIYSGKQVKLGNISNYYSCNGQFGMVVQKEKGRFLLTKTFIHGDLLKMSTIDTLNAEIKDIAFSSDFSKICYLTFPMNSNEHGTLRYCELLKGSAETLAKGKPVQELLGFSQDENSVFINFVNNTNKVKLKQPVKLNIWSYKDIKLQSEQLNENQSDVSLYRLNISGDHLVELIKSNEDLLSDRPGSSKYRSDEFMIARDRIKLSESGWNKRSQVPIFLVDTKTGRRKILADQTNMLKSIRFELSPNAKFVINYGRDDNNYYSYDIISGIRKNITKDIATSWKAHFYGKNDFQNFNVGIAGWSDNDRFVYLYDEYDIWKVDPRGMVPAINITHGYGRKYGVGFELILDEGKKVPEVGSLVLSALNYSDLSNGFYSIKLGSFSDPQKLTMDNAFYFSEKRAMAIPDQASFKPIGNKEGMGFIVRKMTASTSPNFFYTTNFINYTRLSSVAPEKNYNWYTTKLMQWTSVTGENLQGVLYLPEDFDSTKRYPVVIHYYEVKSNNVNIYLKAKEAQGDLNIPTFVSNGYLVFTPDIKYTDGNPGQSAYNSVMSGVELLKKLSFVNEHKIGLQGFSFGGLETNYIVSKSGNVFSAASSSAGVSDPVSFYGGLKGDGSLIGETLEVGQIRMSQPPWKLTENYLDHSAILNSGQISTPMLLMHTTNDAGVPFSQAVQLFTALRRQEKPVWLLEYGDGNHGIWGDSAKDYTLRLKQFFDYYLRDSPPPKWMTAGRAAKLREFDNALELDGSGAKP